MTADFDRDGWLDLFVVNLDGEASALLRNRTDEPGVVLPPDMPAATPNYRFLALKLVGAVDENPATGLTSSKTAAGARVEMTADFDDDGNLDPDETIVREVYAGSGNAASNSVVPANPAMPGDHAISPTPTSVATTSL